MKEKAHRFAMRIVLGALLLVVSGAALANTVVVRPGDTLIIIAERELGDRNRFREICELNIRILRHDCNYLVVGTELILPERKGAQKAAAKMPAPKKPAPGSRSSGEPSTVRSDFTARFGRFSRQTLNAPEPYQVQLERDFVKISGHVTDAPAGGKPGVWLKVPRFVERRASDSTVLITVVVRAPTPGPIALTYSRDGVDNSGWITKGAGTKFRSLSFTYKVPSTYVHDGDYIGILPDPRNVGQVVDVAEISIDMQDASSLSETGETLGASAREWTFDDGAEGFSVASGNLTWQSNGSIRVAATGAGVKLHSPGKLSINGAENTVVSARIRVTDRWGSEPGWAGRVFYATEQHGFSRSYWKQISEPSLVLNQWRILSWDMEKLTKGGTDWVDSIIGRLRIDLQDSRSQPYGIVEIDWIRVDAK